MIGSLFFLFLPALLLFGYQSVLEEKGINDPTLAVSLYKTTIVLDVAIKLLLFCFIDDLDVFAIIGLFVTLGFFSWFYVCLSLGIPKKSLRRFRKFPQETNYTVCAFTLIGFCAISILFNLVILLFGWSFDDPVEIYILCIIIAAMIFLYMIFAARSLIRLDRLKYPSMRSLNALSHNNSPIVLLRSFMIDSNPMMNGKVFDETICENLNLEKNPIISLANPDEILPSGGSLKIQAKDSEWKEVVKEVLKHCRAVILVEGLSNGLHWEISKLKDYLNNKQLYVLIPAKTYRELAWCYNDEVGAGLYSIIRNAYRYMAKITFFGRKDRNQILNAVWIDFTSKLQQFGINTPNIFPGENSILSFDENWNGNKENSVHNMGQMLDFIVSRTISFNKSDFDYQKLGEKIALFEINGFLSKDEIAPFKLLVDKCNRIGRVVALICFSIFIVGMIFSIF